VLRGRRNEREVFDRLLAAVRAGESRALVVRGGSQIQSIGAARSRLPISSA
jgi:hypothetical protein